MAGLTIDGLISGMDTQKIIDQLMTLERKPVVLLKQQISRLDTARYAWLDINKRLDSLAGIVTDLKDVTLFTQKSAKSSNTEIVSAGTTHNAVAGSYHLTVDQLATSSKLVSVSDIGQALNTTVAATEAGFGTKPTTGTITIQGVTIDVDSSKSLDDIVAAVNQALTDAGAGVQVEFTANDTFRVYDTTGTGQTISLGSSADTSNFLDVTGVLTATQSGSAIESPDKLGRVDLHALMQSDGARFNTDLTASSGSFKINGVEISWDATADALADVLKRIDNSAAGVNAVYDKLTDKIQLVNKETGSLDIVVEDVSGNLMQSLDLDGAATSRGVNALFTIDEVNGGAQLSSTKNTVDWAIEGVTLNLKQASAEKVTLDIKSDTSKAVDKIKAFVEQYNSALSFIDDKLSVGDPADPNDNGPLAGDATLMRVQNHLRQQTSEFIASDSTIENLIEIGVTLDSETNLLTLDETKLKGALSENPENVHKLFYSKDTEQGLSVSLGDYVDGLVKDATGTTVVRADGLDRSISSMNKQIESIERRLELRRQRLTRDFLAMEKALSTMQSQSQWLMGMIANMQGSASSNS